MNEDLLKAYELFDDGMLSETLVLLDKLLKNSPDDEDALLLRAKVFYRQQKWGEALNVLNQILAVNSENVGAANYKSMVIDILTFWNKDNFNP